MIANVYKHKRRVGGKLKVARLYRGRFKLDGDARFHDVALKVTDKRIAQERLNAMIAELERERAGLLPPPKLRESASRSLKDHVSDFVADLRTKQRNREYVKRIEQRLAVVFDACGWVALRDVNPDAFVGWRHGRSELSPKTLNEYLAALVGLFNWLKRMSRVERNPFEALGRVDGRGKAKLERRALSLQELGQLRLVCGNRWAAYLTAVKTGLRRGELEQLQWQDVHLNGDRAFLRLRAATTKNRIASDHPLDAEVSRVLRELSAKSAKPLECVFRGRLPRRETVQADFLAAGIARFDQRGRKADFHALRTTYCTMLAEAELPERVRQELMRHRDPRLTNQTYTDPARLRLAEAVSKLPKLSDTQIGTHDLVSPGPNVSSIGTTGQAESERKPLPESTLGRDLAQTDATRQNGLKTGGGGNRICRETRSIGQNTTSSPHRRSTLDI